MIFVRFLLLLMAAGYAIYAGQLEMALSVLCAYIIGFVFVKYVLKSRTIAPLYLFELFFLIYGSLVLFSHIELIHDPDVDYFVHSDASQSFYQNIMDYAVPTSEEGGLLRAILLNPFFLDYPLAAYLFTALAKIGIWLGIVNIRLFLRIHVFLLAALIVATMAKLLTLYYNKKQVYKLIIPFGLFSYLYITSAIFTRDTHVCFVCTLVAYCYLNPQCKYKILKVFLLAILAAGFRPENGLMVLIFVMGLIYDKLRQKKISGLVVPLGIVAIVGCVASGALAFVIDVFTSFNERTIDVVNAGGLFMKMYTMPFPLNSLLLIAYSAIMPLPFLFYVIGEGGTILTLPFILSPYLLWSMFIAVFWYIRHYFYKDSKRSMFGLISILCFAMLILVEPNVRRSFAVIPGLYMLYALIKDQIPFQWLKQKRMIGWVAIAVVNIFAAVYIYL